jgi:hypothetical protein
VTNSEPLLDRLEPVLVTNDGTITADTATLVELVLLGRAVRAS